MKDRCYRSKPFDATDVFHCNGQTFSQLDLVTTTLFGNSRFELLSNNVKGHGFWTDEEKDFFKLMFQNSVKRGNQVSYYYVKQFVCTLSHVYHRFASSLLDPKICKSIYYCLRYLCKKRDYKVERKDLCLGPYGSTECNIARAFWTEIKILCSCVHHWILFTLFHYMVYLYFVIYFQTFVSIL